MSEISLKVSIGEAIDKLTILEIKLNKIKDDRKKDVETEYFYLFEELKKYAEKFKFYYDFLKEVNLKIWELQDEIRSNHQNFISKAEDILFLNDARFVIKNKINSISNSKFNEQKGYTKRKLYIKNKDLISEESLLRISVFYDEVIYIDILDDLKDTIDFQNINENIITHPYVKKNLINIIMNRK